MVTAALLLGGLTTAYAAKAPPPTPTAEDLCQAARAKAAGQYAACQQSAQSKWQLKADQPKFLSASSKCHVKYAHTWVVLQGKAGLTGSSCDASHDRFVDNADDTFTDNLTGLQWEEKTNLNNVVNLLDPHDADNTYTWSATSPAADGTAFTAFLASLNTAPACFAGQCDWRLPTKEELQTLLSDPFPCVNKPCIDPTLGSTQGATDSGPNPPTYWTSSTYMGQPDNAWVVDFFDGSVKNFGNDKIVDMYVRAVRGGL